MASSASLASSSTARRSRISSAFCARESTTSSRKGTSRRQASCAPRPRCARSLFRSFLSVSYNRLLRLSLSAGFTDAQCGFKAINRRVADELLPPVKSSRWFFDTELLVLAENAGYRIKDLPVLWVEDPDSRVQIHKAIAEDLVGVLELRRRLSASSPGPGALPRRERGGASARR